MLTPFRVGIVHVEPVTLPAHSAHSIRHGMNVDRSVANLFRRTRARLELKAITVER